MTTIRQLNLAIPAGYHPSARYAARKAAEKIGAKWLGGAYVETDEAIAEVRINRNHSIAWAVEATCPEVL